MSGSQTPTISSVTAAGQTPASTQGAKGKRGRRFFLAACLLAVLLIPSAHATPGALDLSFGVGGKVTTEVGCCSANAYAYALARQPDGKLLVAGAAYSNVTAGDFALARYNPDGSLDSTFGASGKVMTEFGFGWDVANALALQSDGKIVVAGYAYSGPDNDFAIARYNSDGSLDTSFNGTGKVITSIGPGNDYANRVVLQPDGKIVVAGRSFNGSNDDFAIVRYNPDGSLDATFNGTGKVTTAIGSGDDAATAVAVQPAGKLVVAGRAWNGSQEAFALARYNPNGSLDTGFNGSGKVTTAISDYDAADALALQPDGKLVAAGVSTYSNKFDFALARYNPDGSLDSAFGSGGKVTTAIGTGDDSVEALVLQPDGKLVTAGYSYAGSSRLFALARYNPNGSLDTGFNGSGKATTAIGSDDQAYALALQPDGKLVAAGFSWNGSQYVFALARYRGSTLTVAKTGSGSGSVTSSPNGINCGSACSAPFAAVPVTLTATASAGSSFAGWSGACSGTGPCTLTMSADHAATASFETDKTLTFTKAGSGTGTVTSTPAGISCGSTCTHAFRHGTSVTLTATAAAGSSLVGWSGGGCSGRGTCTVTLDANKSVTATFEPDKTLTVAKQGGGTGTVTSSPAGIACGSSCSHAYAHGTSVTLTASASPTSKFAGWSADCSGSGTCTLTMGANHSATAIFKPLCVVPKVKGKTLKAAKKAIKRAHCSVGKATRAFSAKVKKGRVISQKPKPGKKLAAGSKVKLEVSKGKKT